MTYCSETDSGVTLEVRSPRVKSTGSPIEAEQSTTYSASSRGPIDIPAGAVAARSLVVWRSTASPEAYEGVPTEGSGRSEMGSKRERSL